MIIRTIVRLGGLLVAAFTLFILAGSVNAGEVQPSIGRLVLAHYMVCCPRFGQGAQVQDYVAEIRLAREAGIDGFALNVGGWSKEPNYQRKSQLLFDAAAASGTDFKLVFSFDFLSGEDAVDAVQHFSGHPNYLKLGSLIVITTFGTSGAWGRQVRKALEKDGIRIFLVANYFERVRDASAKLDPLGPEMYAARRAIEDNPDIDGYFLFFSSLGNDERLARMQAEVVRIAHQHGKIAMLGVIPYYKGFGPRNSRVFESNGFSAMAAQWRTAIERGADWVELVTWNDWGESTYVSPAAESILGPERGRLLPHDGFLYASRYYIDWFKTGQPPEIKTDKIFFFYRLHPKTAPGLVRRDKRELGQPLGWEKLNDAVFFASFLTQPARLKVRIGNTESVVELKAGAQTASVPMAIGEVAYEVVRNEYVLGSGRLPESIGTDGERGNFNYTSGALDLAP